jgi:hypothetical protein
MFSFFRQTFRQWARSGTRSSAQKAPVRNLQCEALEDRVLPSVTGSELLVNTQKVGLQSQAVTATSSNGMSVVVWTDFNKTRAGLPTSEYANDGYIKAQRYNAYGQKVGGEILVAGTRTPQHNPTVALDSHGNFVVAWVYDYDSTDTDIHAARFFASGARNGSEFAVAQSPKNEYDPNVAMDARGDFVVSYTYQFGSSDSDIHANLYRYTGSLVRTIEVAITSQNEYHSHAAMTADGRFAIAYEKTNDIVVQRYSSYGTLLGTNTVAHSSYQQKNPALTIDNRGNVIVAWQVYVNSNWNVLARSVSSSGVLSSTFTVAATSAQETNPSIAVDPLTGKFVVAYQSQSGRYTNVVVKEFYASHGYLSTATALTNVHNPAISVGGSAHHFLVVGDSFGAKLSDYDGGVFARFGVL